MRNRIFGIIVIVWGGAMIAHYFERSGRVGSDAYGADLIIGYLAGALLSIFGVYYTFKGNK